MIVGEPMVLQALAISAALAAAAPGDVTVREPTLPDAWVQTFEVRCGGERFRVANYGARLPYPGTGPIITSNGRPVRGRQIETLRRDLSTRRAAYRLTGQCLPDGEGIWFRIYRGEMTYPGERPPGLRVFHAGAAIICGGRLERYRGLEPTTEEDFWFRSSQPGTSGGMVRAAASNPPEPRPLSRWRARSARRGRGA